MPGVHDLVTEPNGEGTRVTFDVDNDSIGAVLTAMSTLGVRSFTAAPPSLEELFMRHYGDQVAVDGTAGRGGSDDATGRHAVADGVGGGAGAR
jgi:ABC-2 type transport system ATP-binding protein